jgi:XTP/dITP diphosphohydrolase
MTSEVLLMATMNRHKLAEAEFILKSAGLVPPYILRSMQDIGFSGDIPEEEDTLEGNSRAKSLFAYRMSKLNCFADDTGLEVEHLGGAPGVHSARYAGTDALPGNNIRLLLNNLLGAKNRQARFRTVISLILHGEEYQFEGVVSGEILVMPEGDKGFGYDPVFRPDGYSCSFATMAAEEKNRISHRYQAIRKMADFLKDMNNRL